MLATIVAVLLLLPSSTEGQKEADRLVTTHNGALTGQAFRELPEDQKWFYAVGLLDGMFLAPIFGAPESKVEWLGTCAEGMTNVQLAAIISRPSRRSSLSALVLEAPFAPLHDAECAGICPTCGADLNEGPCGCEAQVDGAHPFAGLGDLFEEPGEQ
jgi:hypothetical protein